MQAGGLRPRGPTVGKREEGGRSSRQGLQTRSRATYGGKVVRLCINLGQGIVFCGMRRRPRVGDVIISFGLVQEDIYPGDETLVGHRFDGAGGKELYKKVAVGDKIVAQADIQGYRLPPPPYPSEGVVDGAKFPCVAGGPHGTNRGGAGSGRDNRSPKRLSLVGARDSDVKSPACRVVRKHRTVGERESSGVFE